MPIIRKITTITLILIMMAHSIPVPLAQAAVESLRLDLGSSLQKSGAIKQKQTFALQDLAKDQFRPDEEVTITVANPDNEPLTAEVFDNEGEKADVTIEKDKTYNGEEFTLTPQSQFTPGKYKVVVTDKQGNKSEQNFTWGVLALNTDRSIYHPNQTAELSFAVLNDKGDMVCDARLELRITNYESGIEEKLSTETEEITINDQCKSHNFSLQPDYEATYQVGEPGTYHLTLTAETGNGSYTITDSILVQEEVAFDIQRRSATRIYPPHYYPVDLTITANQDFTGTITETVPASFTIAPAESNQSYETMQTVYIDDAKDPKASLPRDVLGASTSALTLPFQGPYPISQGFGTQMTESELLLTYLNYGIAGHDGIDFATPNGTPIYAVDEGNVLWAGPGDYGITVIIQHTWGRSYYGHLQEVAVEKNTHITKGAKIALSGNTGESTGPHLHLGIKPNDADIENGYLGKVDPLPYFNIPSTSTLAENLSVEPETTVLGASTSAETTNEAPTPTPSEVPLASAETTASTPAAEQSFTVTEKQLVAGALGQTTTENAEKVKVLKWNVSLKKGETTTLGYQFKTPQISPQFYLLGPLRFYGSADGKSNQLLFSENRHWQIAADAMGTRWYNYNWQYRKQVTVDHTKVGSGATWWDSSWTKRKAVSIVNSGSALTNYQVQLTVTYDADMQADFDDLRFTNSSGTALDYWIESKTDSSTATVWVEVDSIAASATTTIYMYYSNGAASAGSNGDNTFTFFDDFSSFDTATWTATGSQTTSGGVMTVTTGAVYSDATVGTMADQVVESKVKWNGLANEFSGMNINNTQTGESGNPNGDKLVYNTSDSGGTSWIAFANNTGAGYNVVNNSAIGTLSTTPDYIVSTTVSSSQIIYQLDRGATDSQTYSATWTGTYYMWFGYFSGAGAGTTNISDIAVDWTLVRQYASTTPTNSFGPESEETLTNYPVLVNLTSDSNLAAKAQTDADDILFTDSTGTVKLSHEVEKYTDSTGALIAWVEVPTLSSTTDTTLYMYYGNQAASNQQDATNVWSASYAGVWHLKEDPSGAAPQMADSTSNVNSLTSNGGMTTGDQITGQIDGSLDFDGTDDSIYDTDNATFTPSTSMTLSAWVKFDLVNGTTRKVIYKGHNASPFFSYFFEIDTGDDINFFWTNNSSTTYSSEYTGTVTAGTWYYVTGVKNATSVQIYINASTANTTTTTPTGTLFDSNDNFMVANNFNGGTEPLNGDVDEIRLASTERSGTWITTDYNNQSSPSTFYTLGTQETKLYAGTLEELMRHGEILYDGTEQPLLFAQ